MPRKFRSIATCEERRDGTALIIRSFATALATFSCGAPLRDPQLRISFPHRQFYFCREFYFYYKFYSPSSRKYFLGIAK